MELTRFLEKYQPGDTEVVSEELVDKYAHILPASIITLWRTKGLGKYNDGLIEVINPDDFQDTLERTLGRKALNYVPIAISGFGDLFYYRKLTVTDEDVCLFDPHYNQVETCVWSLVDFFNGYLCDDDIIAEVLRKDLFNASLKKAGGLKKNEIYFFVPALALGGSENIEHVQKGNCQTHLSILFQSWSAKS
ncbi:hypothetical protein TH53_14185 [Pedobacter lusitanus]|uniref:GAD-like domain protein n=1 Tax=Pedobacter lusitanus TaxID=1503925 RepID=A0A0D0GH09_9SPHI|nr:T6SS immunity protein Tdi1 domain-containing protein [Pedobacter lusitanus]KIO76587.1 hypothetical protein TH53_14185 [Pedobacter lusitanus]